MCGEHSLCSGRAASSFGALSPGAARLFPPRRAARAARSLALSPRACRALFLRGPSARRWSPVGSPEVFRQDPGPVCRVGGGGFSGAEFAPFPPPASYLQRGWGSSSLEFLSPFVLQTAGGVFGRLIFPSLSHSLKNLPPTALRAFWPVLTLRNAAGSSPFRPLLLVAGAGVWGTFLLGVAFRHVICGPYLISPPS